MTPRGKGPNAIGDVPTLQWSYTAPDSAPTATPSTVTVTTLKPDGTQLAAENATGSGLDWSWAAADPIDQSGTWYWRIYASGALTDAYEFGIRIEPSKFT